MSEKAKQRLWDYYDLIYIYKNTSNKLLGERLLHIINWAIDRGALIDGREQGKRGFPQFQLMGKHDRAIFSFWSPEPNHSKPGTVHFTMPLHRFGGDVGYRKNLVIKLNPLLGYDYDPDNINGSRTSKRALHEISQEEFNAFMAILDEYCYKNST